MNLVEKFKAFIDAECRQDQVKIHRLEALLSALRGPDIDEDRVAQPKEIRDLKSRTTWRVRDAVAPWLFGMPLCFPIPLDKPRDNESSEAFKRRLRKQLKGKFPIASNHFLDHYTWACWMYWEETRG